MHIFTGSPLIERMNAEMQRPVAKVVMSSVEAQRTPACDPAEAFTELGQQLGAPAIVTPTICTPAIGSPLVFTAKGQGLPGDKNNPNPPSLGIVTRQRNCTVGVSYSHFAPGVTLIHPVTGTMGVILCPWDSLPKDLIAETFDLFRAQIKFSELAFRPRSLWAQMSPDTGSKVLLDKADRENFLQGSWRWYADFLKPARNGQEWVLDVYALVFQHLADMGIPKAHIGAKRDPNLGQAKPGVIGATLL